MSDGDIEHWQRTQRGPNKITAVLVGTKYPSQLRVHAARALVQMRHPNASGLDLLVQAMAAMQPADREPIIHELLAPITAQMNGTGQAAAATGPSEAQIRAKDAAFLLLRFASPTDRGELSKMLLDWLLADVNSRALAGLYSADQVVQAIGPTAVDRLVEVFTARDEAISVTVNIAQYISRIGNDAGKDAAVAKLVAVANEVSGAGYNAQLEAYTRRVLAPTPSSPQPAPQRVQQVSEEVRKQYLTLVYEALRTLARPAGTQYLITVAANPANPMERRKLVLSAIAGQVHTGDAHALAEIAHATTATDVELRGLAVDRLGETRDAASLAELWTLFDTSNGGEQGNEFTLRWKAGEAVLKIGGPGILPTFVQHLETPRAGFGGFTYAEVNGYALTLGDFSPPPRDAVRTLLDHPNVDTRALAVLFLANKGETADLARLGTLANDATAITGPGWAATFNAPTSPANTPCTLGRVATRSRDVLQHGLTQPANAAAP